MHSQANVRAERCAAAPSSSAAVRDRGHWKAVAGSGWVRGAGRGETARGWKGVRSWVRLESWSGEPVRSPKNTSARTTFIDKLFKEIYNKTMPTTQSVKSLRI